MRDEAEMVTEAGVLDALDAQFQFEEFLLRMVNNRRRHGADVLLTTVRPWR
jgi:hypothetical protein